MIRGATQSDFRPAIRRALNQPCRFDFLRAHQVEDQTGKTSRVAFRRLMHLLSYARAGLLGNANELAREFGTCTKTIYRDVEFLRREFNLPLTFNKLTRSYELSQPKVA